MTNPAQTMLELAERLDNMETHQRKNMGGKNRFNSFLNGTLAHEAADALRAAASAPAQGAGVGDNSPNRRRVSEVETVGWAILQALHEGAEEGPQSWSDLAEDQEKRIKKAAVAAIEAVTDLSQYTAQGFSWPVQGAGEPVAWQCHAKLRPEVSNCNWPDCGCEPRSTEIIAALVEQGWKPSSDRPAPDLCAYIPDIVKNAMLTMWNYICDDTKHHPLDIEHCRGKLLTFEPKHWAQFTGEMVQRNIRDLFGPGRPASQPGTLAREEVGWLIEVMGDNGVPTYHQLIHDDDWTFDASKALRFSRREDAQAYINHIGWTIPKPVEHMWCDPLTPSYEAGTQEPAAWRWRFKNPNYKWIYSDDCPEIASYSPERMDREPLYAAPASLPPEKEGT